MVRLSFHGPSHAIATQIGEHCMPNETTSFHQKDSHVLQMLGVFQPVPAVRECSHTQAHQGSTWLVAGLHSSQDLLHAGIKGRPGVRQVLGGRSLGPSLGLDEGQKQLCCAEGCGQLGHLASIQQLPPIGLQPAQSARASCMGLQKLNMGARPTLGLRLMSRGEVEYNIKTVSIPWACRLELGVPEQVLHCLVCSLG